MHESMPLSEACPVHVPPARRARERGMLAVVLLTATMMVVEIVVGYLAHSMALLADGWHMATHVGALGLASVAYALSRRYASHRAFALGTGKLDALAGYTNALVLGIVALVMIAESVQRLLHPSRIDFVTSLPVAVAGLAVNLLSVRLLEHGHDDDPEDGEHHGHGADHNHRAALMHVIADALTSALAILALLAGRFLGWSWLDAASGVVGGLVILNWGVGLCRATAFELLNLDPSLALEGRIRQTLEELDDVRVRDLHVWSLGRGARSCVVTVVSESPRDVEVYRERLAGFELAHLTVEVRRCVEGHSHVSRTVPG